MSLYLLIYTESKSSSTIIGHLKKSYLQTFVVIIFYLLNRSRVLNETKATEFLET
jgi:hypothetical protein